ncbi:MAG: hypothetical protein AB8B99_20210 [Phormidesmis sp.]
MASTHNGILLQQLVSAPAGETFAGGSSPALLALKRWGRGLFKHFGVGLLSLVVLLNLGLGSPQMALPQMGELAASLPASEHKQPRESGRDMDLSRPAGRLAETRASQDSYYRLDAHMTRYRLTRSRLSIPRSAEPQSSVSGEGRSS